MEVTTCHIMTISIHKALASLDSRGVVIKSIGYISIHKALASLDSRILIRIHITGYFNPQGSREPRQNYASAADIQMGFQSTRLSRASTLLRRLMYHLLNISIHKALASLDEDEYDGGYYILHISIHKALASLDSDMPSFRCGCQISIHKALASLDLWRSTYRMSSCKFQSTRLSRASTVIRTDVRAF